MKNWLTSDVNKEEEMTKDNPKRNNKKIEEGLKNKEKVTSGNLWGIK